MKSVAFFISGLSDT